MVRATEVVTFTYVRVRVRAKQSEVRSRPVKRKSQRRAWIFPCEGTRLVLYTKDHARAKMRPLYVKIMIYSPFNLAVGRLKKKKKKKKKKMEKIAVWPISVYNSSDVF